jgi:hypothetical protein
LTRCRRAARKNCKKQRGNPAYGVNFYPQRH